ncbi:hypothetical protein [Kitasatospora sp. NPDC001175]|uniref:hypothetical protein n=1 Tax=Kitasatospora sp. NPDC001175 TaxID=3157103 RepID=UPI003D082AE5
MRYTTAAATVRGGQERPRRRRLPSRTAVALAAAAVTVGSIAVPASAATAGTARLRAQHSGTSGCFNWSWADGWTTSTLYFHNTCRRKEWLHIEWSSGDGFLRGIDADAKGHAEADGSVLYVEDGGPYN